MVARRVAPVKYFTAQRPSSPVPASLGPWHNSSVISRHEIRRFGLIALLLPVLAALPSGAQSPAKEVKEFLELSGLKEISSILPDSILAGLDEQRNQFDQEIYPRLQMAFENGFTAERLYAAMEAEIAERSSSPHFPSALEWMRGPFAREMNALEMETSRTENAGRVREYGAALKLQPPPEARRDLITRMDHAQGGSEAGLKFQMAILRALIEGASSLQSGGGPLPPEQMEAVLENARAQLGGQVRGQVIIAMRYTYRDVPDETLLPYVEYWETEEGRWLAEALQTAMLRGLEAAGRHTGAFIALQGVEVGPRD